MSLSGDDDRSIASSIPDMMRQPARRRMSYSGLAALYPPGAAAVGEFHPAVINNFAVHVGNRHDGREMVCAGARLEALPTNRKISFIF